METVLEEWGERKEYAISSNLQPTPLSFSLSAVFAPCIAEGGSHGAWYCSGYAGTPRSPHPPPLMERQTHTHLFDHAYVNMS